MEATTVTVYVIVSNRTDAIVTGRIFANPALAWSAIDAMASWLATKEQLRKEFNVVSVEVETEPTNNQKEHSHA
jgi:hypothetical protein